MPDLGVVKIGEVAQEEREALALGQLRDCLPNRFVELGSARRGQLGRLTRFGADGPPIGSRVDGGAPRIRLERATPSDAAPASHDADERILHGVRTQLLVAR